MAVSNIGPGATSVTVDRNGKNIQGAAANDTVTVPTARLYTYDGVNSWVKFTT